MSFSLGGRHLYRLAASILLLVLLVFSALAAAPLGVAAAATAASASSNTYSQAAQTPENPVPVPLSGFTATSPLPPSATVDVEIGIPLRNLDQLQSLVQQVSTLGSPSYDHFLTSAEVAQEFLPTGQYNQVVSFLDSHGFSVVTSSLDSSIVAQGTVAQASKYLGLSFELYSNGTTSYYNAYGSSPFAGDYIYSSNFTAIYLSHPTDLLSASQGISPQRQEPSQTNQTAPIEFISLSDLQPVYNASGLLSKGVDGKGYTIGILDFDGDPYIAQQLQYYDEAFNVPAPPSFNVIGLQPYNPGLGVETGWAPEISLDVESAHTMAPGASIDLYIGNNALPLSVAVGAVMQQDKVNDLSQSFGIPEYLFSTPVVTGGLQFNVILPDQYYLLGSAEGITSLAASGDNGGSGDSAGPLGGLSYPPSSPYVTSVGGTTTYLQFSGSQVSSFEQTAWSAYGFVPYFVNDGGTNGGVSMIEPLPWYQTGITVPASFPDGRLGPDLSLNANIYPAVYVILPGNVTQEYGGTSEASPLLAGLLTLVMQSSKSSLGLINPMLYSLGESASTYKKVFDPITFGYNIPWTASSGYNLVTGWGAPNIGELAHYASSVVTQKMLTINIATSATGQFEFVPGQQLPISAQITSGSTPVTTGTFAADLDTLQGQVTKVPLSYSSALQVWQGTITIPSNASGFSLVHVSGSSNGVSGSGSVELFTGYVAQYLSPAAGLPYSSEFGTPVDVNISTLSGAPVENGTFSATVSTYSILKNVYTPVATVPLNYTYTDYGLMWGGLLAGNFPDGPMLLSMNGGAWGYLAFINGVGLETSAITSSVLVMPGSVAPGQAVFINAVLTPPENTPFVVSTDTGELITFDLSVGSNVTATLVSPSGVSVSSTHLYYNTFVGSAGGISGLLQVPNSTAPGLYYVILDTTFDSANLGASINGSYFGEIYVSSPESVPVVSVSPSAVFEGQTVAVNAKISYSNGTAVKYGLYSAEIIPKALQDFYPTLSGDVYVPQVNLWYDSQTGLWTGSATLPSLYNEGGDTINIDALFNSGPYVISVTGVSAYGVPTTTDTSAQYPLYVQPYTYVSGQTLSSPLPESSQVIFSNDTISGPITLAQDQFVGANSISGGSVTISSSQINGTLDVSNAQLTLVGVTGGTIVATNSKIVLDQSSVGSLSLAGSQVSMNASSFGKVTPSLPTISVQSPAANKNFNGSSGAISIAGQGVSSVSVYLDGALLTTMTGSEPSYTFQLPSSSLPDGVHSLQVVAKQQDGLSSSDTVYFSTNGELTAASNSIGSLQNQLTSATSTISALSSQLSSANSTIGSLGQQLNSANGNLGGVNSKLNSESNTITSLADGLYAMAAVAAIALVLAVAAMARKGGGQSSPPQQTTPAAAQPPSSPPMSGSTRKEPVL